MTPRWHIPCPRLTCAAGIRARPRRERHLDAAGMEPAQEFPGCLLDGRPESIALVPLVIGQERGQDLILDLLPGRGDPARDKAHHIGIGIQAHQVVRIGSSEPPQHQPVRLKENLQSWAQKELSRISFGTPRTLAWDADGGGFAGAARRTASGGTTGC
jgi:hypothetical protein